jgi:hypothetical protein
VPKVASPPLALGGGPLAVGAKALLVLAIGGGAVATIRAVDAGPHAEPHTLSSPGTPPTNTTMVVHETNAQVLVPTASPDVPAKPPVPASDETSVRSTMSPPATVRVPPARSTGPAKSPVTVAPGASLREERSLLDAARTAIVRGEPDAALVATAAHEARFPQGALAEERDALRIRALARLGRSDDARALLATMRAKYPHSFLLQGAAADVASIP